MGKNKNGSLKRNVPPPLPSDYDLARALNTIRRGAKSSYDTAEGTKTDIRVGSVNINVWSNPEGSSETETQLDGRYVTEQYVQSIVNSLKAEQKDNSTRLTELINNKIDGQNTKIQALKEKSLSREGFWVGIGIVVSVLGIFLSIVYSNIRDYREGLDAATTTIETNRKTIKVIDGKVDSMGNVVLDLKEKLDTPVQQSKKETVGVSNRK